MLANDAKGTYIKAQRKRIEYIPRMGDGLGHTLVVCVNLLYIGHFVASAEMAKRARGAALASLHSK